MDLGLTDRVAVVTGASEGLGRGVAEAFVAEGVAVVGPRALVSKDIVAIAGGPLTNSPEHDPGSHVPIVLLVLGGSAGISHHSPPRPAGESARAAWPCW